MTVRGWGGGFCCAGEVVEEVEGVAGAVADADG